MKKKILAVLLTAAMAIGLVACGAKEPEAKDVTITFVNNEETLGSLTTKAGQTVTGYEQFENVEGFSFDGWFGTPTFVEASALDLATATFEEDTTVFGSFKNANVTEDTRSWYIVGEGASPVLQASAWAGSDVSDDDKAACQLNLTGNVTNEFQITVDLFAGDKFQVITNWGWDTQYGFGKVTEFDESEFESGGGLSGEANKANIAVLKDGNYTITVTTDPDNDKQDTFVIVRNGDPLGAAGAVVTAENYVVSDATGIVMKGSWVDDWSENIDLDRNEGTNVFVGTKELDAETELYFMVWDNGADTGIGMNSTAVVDDASKALIDTEANNVKVLEAGTYTFTVDADTLTIVITK